MHNGFKKLGSLFCMIAGILVITSDASAQETCAPFTLISTGDARSVEYVDIGVEGGSHADKRIGVRKLRAEDGSDAGHARWMLTVLEPQGNDARASHIEWVFSLPDGVIFAKGLKAITNSPDDTSKQSNDASEQFAIVGSTDVYAGARATPGLPKNLRYLGLLRDRRTCNGKVGRGYNQLTTRQYLLCGLSNH